MTCFEKSPLRLKTQTLYKKYDTFAVAQEQGKNGVFAFDLAGNCDLSDGTARVGVGAEIFTLVSGKHVVYDWSLSAPKAFFYCGEKFGFLSDENKLYFYDESTRVFRLAYTFGGEMTFVEAQDDTGVYRAYFVGEAGAFSYTQEAGAVLLSGSAYLPAARSFQGRIFTAVSDSIVYSAPFSAGDFAESIDGGGRIVLPSDTGEVVDLAATSEAVFVLCKRGIWKLTAAGSARDFRLERVGFTGGQIVKGSACVAACSSGEKVYFFTKSGICKLDHSGVEAICKNLDLMMRSEGQVCEHAYLDGKIFYAYRAKDLSVRSVVIDVETDKGYSAFTAEGVSDLRGQAVGVVDGLVYAIKEDVSLPTWRIAELVVEKYDFGVSGMKTLKGLRIFGEGEMTLSVSNGRKTKTFALQTENGVASVDVKLRGEYFRVRFTLGMQTRVRGLEAELCRLSGLE